MSTTENFLAAMAAGASAQNSFNNAHPQEDERRTVDKPSNYYSINPPACSVIFNTGFSIKMLIYMRAQRSREMAKVNKCKFGGA